MKVRQSYHLQKTYWGNHRKLKMMPSTTNRQGRPWKVENIMIFRKQTKYIIEKWSFLNISQNAYQGAIDPPAS